MKKSPINILTSEDFWILWKQTVNRIFTYRKVNISYHQVHRHQNILSILTILRVNSLQNNAYDNWFQEIQRKEVDAASGMIWNKQKGCEVVFYYYLKEFQLLSLVLYSNGTGISTPLIREVNKNNLMGGQFLIFLPKNLEKLLTGWASLQFLSALTKMVHFPQEIWDI